MDEYLTSIKNIEVGAGGAGSLDSRITPILDVLGGKKWVLLKLVFFPTFLTESGHHNKCFHDASSGLFWLSIFETPRK